MLATARIDRGAAVGSSSTEGKRFVYDIFMSMKPQKGIDIGCGRGTYARLFPELDWTGVEVWEPYVDKFSLDRLYERFILADAREWTPDDRYDVAVAGDVLEHMTVNDAVALLAKLKACADTVIVSIPIVHFPQDEIGGNPYERHVVEDWTVESVIAAFGQPDWHGVEIPAGVFMWRNPNSEGEASKVD